MIENYNEFIWLSGRVRSGTPKAKLVCNVVRPKEVCYIAVLEWGPYIGHLGLGGNLSTRSCHVLGLLGEGELDKQYPGIKCGKHDCESEEFER